MIFYNIGQRNQLCLEAGKSDQDNCGRYEDDQHRHFDTLAMMDKTFGVFGGNLADFNAQLHESTAYNAFQIGVTALAAFTGGMSSTMSCFVAGTLVLTACGLVAIENIKAGDKVISTDPETGVTEEKTVLETF